MTSDEDQPAATSDLGPADDAREHSVISSSPAEAPTAEVEKTGAPGDNELPGADSDESAVKAVETDTSSRRTMVAGVSIVAAVVVGILVLVLTTSGDGPVAAPGSPSTSSASTPPTLPPSAFKTFSDPLTGFSMQYPTSWGEPAQTPISELRLVVTPGQGEAVSVRVNVTEQPTTPENLGNLKAVTDGIVGSNPNAKVQDQRTVSQNGLIGYWYLYTFTDQASGLEGVHAHYFLFKGTNMYSIVFQAMPVEDFSRFASIFDHMIESFKVDTPAAPPTAAPAPATAP